MHHSRRVPRSGSDRNIGIGVVCCAAACFAAMVLAVPVVAQDTQVNTWTTGTQGFPSIGMQPNGAFVVVWHSDYVDSSGFGVRSQRFASDGTPLGTEFAVSTETALHQAFPRVAIEADGDFVVVWQDFYQEGVNDRGVFGQRVAADGTLSGGEFHVNTYTTGHQRQVQVGMADTGDFIVVWASQGSAGTDGSGNSVQGQRFASSGTPIGPEFQVNSLTTGNQTYPSVAFAPDGSFVVVWQSETSSGTDDSGYGIQARRFDSDGTPSGTEFQVNTVTGFDQRVPKVGTDGAGDFVVVWESETAPRTDESGLSIQGQRFSSDGTPLLGQFQGNTYTALDQGYPQLGVVADGNFVVVWESMGSAGSDQSGASVQGQLFSAWSSRLGGEFQLNTYTALNQHHASVALDGGDSFVVVWESDGSTGSDTSFASVQKADARSFGVLFVNGFESGDVSAWDGSVSPAAPPMTVDAPVRGVTVEAVGSPRARRR